jgi:AraC-like DNA-binding protein/quercetin dioxygenase-like cupin family protein
VELGDDFAALSAAQGPGDAAFSKRSSHRMPSPTLPLQHPLTFTLLASPYFEPDGFPIAVRPMDPQDACPLHDHPFCEIAIVTAGTGVHVIDGRRMALQRGSVLVVDAGRAHAYEEVDGLALQNILFMAKVLETAAAELDGMPGFQQLFGNAVAALPARFFRAHCDLREEALAEILELCGRLESELSLRNPGFRLAAHNCFQDLVLSLVRRLHPQLLEAPGGSAGQNGRGRIHEAIRYLHHQYAEDVDVGRLPRIFGMSERNFRRAFHAETGYAPIEYLARIRVHEAAMQLRAPAPSVTEVAMNVGFKDLSFFGRKFKAILGVTPHLFRENMLRRCSPSPAAPIYPTGC